jgi:hypothetical protein
MPAMKDRKSALTAALLYTVISSPLNAHHSFAAFDMTKTVSMVCTVKEFQWINPHTWLIVVAPNEAGVVQEYRFEGVPPNILTRSGWTQDTLLVGDRISLEYHPNRDGTPGGAYVAVTLPNGKRLGTSGTSFVPFTPVDAPRAPSPPSPPLSHPIELD